MLVFADFFKPFVSRCDVTTPVTLGGVNVFVPLVLVVTRRLEVRCHAHSPNDIRIKKKIASAIASVDVIWFFIVVIVIVSINLYPKVIQKYYQKQEGKKKY